MEETNRNDSVPRKGSSLLDGDTITLERSQSKDPESVKLEENNATPAYRFKTLVLLSTVCGYFLFAYDNTVLANIRPKIVMSLGQVEDLPLLSVAFNVGAISTTLLWHHLYQHFNAKWLFCCSVAGFEVGTALCGASPNMDAMIVGRVIAGSGGIGIYQGTMTFITAMTSTAERPKYLSLVGVGYALGLIGAFTQSDATWRWAFYLLLPVGAVLAPVYILLLPNLAPTDGESLSTRLSKIDYLGWLLWAGIIMGLDLFPSLGGSKFMWSNNNVVGLGVLFGAAFAIFVLQQYTCFLTTRSTRLFPGEMLVSSEMCVQFVAMLSVMTCMITTLYTLPLQLQFAFGDSVLRSGVRLLPFICTLALALIVSGGLMRKIPFYMAYYLSGGILILVGGILLHFGTISRGTPWLLGSSVLVSIGCGICAQTAFSVAQSKSSRSNIASATGFIATAQVGGITLALVISNSVFVNLAAHRLMKLLPSHPREAIVNAVSGVNSALIDSLSPKRREQAIERVNSAIQDVYLISVVGGALLIVLALCMKRENLPGSAGSPSKAQADPVKEETTEKQEA